MIIVGPGAFTRRRSGDKSPKWWLRRCCGSLTGRTRRVTHATRCRSSCSRSTTSWARRSRPSKWRPLLGKERSGSIRSLQEELTGIERKVINSETEIRNTCECPETRGNCFSNNMFYINFRKDIICNHFCLEVQKTVRTHISVFKFEFYV